MEVENIDIVDASSSIAIEVETGKSNVFANMKKLASAKDKYKYVLCVDKLMKRDAGKKLRNSFDQFITISGCNSLSLSTS